MEVAFPPDGLHWSQPVEIPQIDSHGTHPNAFWAPDLGKYVGMGLPARAPPILSARPDPQNWLVFRQ